MSVIESSLIYVHYQDEYRLPDGMKRVGYDADTQKYSYVDQNGDFWEGSEGQEFGELRRGTHNRP